MNIAGIHVRAISFKPHTLRHLKTNKMFIYNIIQDYNGQPYALQKQSDLDNFFAGIGLSKPLFVRGNQEILLNEKEKQNILSVKMNAFFAQKQA